MKQFLNPSVQKHQVGNLLKSTITSPSTHTHASIKLHYNEVLMIAIASQITSLTIVYSSVYSGADQRKHQSSASVALVGGIHWWLVNSPHKGPVTRKRFPIDHVIICLASSVLGSALLRKSISISLSVNKGFHIWLCCQQLRGQVFVILVDSYTFQCLSEKKTGIQKLYYTLILFKIITYTYFKTCTKGTSLHVLTFDHTSQYAASIWGFPKLIHYGI